MMKNIYLLLIIPFCSFFLNIDSTEAQRMDTPGNQWNIGGYTISGPYSGSLKLGENIEVINGLEYHQFLRYRSSDDVWYFVDEFLREDSTQKVYYRNGETEELIYDFNLAVNDTFFFDTDFFSMCKSIIVEEIDSIAFDDGVNRKRLTMRINYAPSHSEIDYWVAGMGSTKYGSFPFSEHCIIDAGEALLCFFENDELVYKNTSGECFLTSVDDQPMLQKIQIYPNPTSDQVIITNDNQQLTHFVLHDLSGKPIQRGILDSNSKIVDLQTLPSGMYFLTITTKSGEQMVEKVLKR